MSWFFEFKNWEQILMTFSFKIQWLLKVLNLIVNKKTVAIEK